MEATGQHLNETLIGYNIDTGTKSIIKLTEKEDEKKLILYEPNIKYRYSAAQYRYFFFFIW
jgi:hypothetical protein